KPPGLTHGIEDPPQPMNPLPNTLPRGIPLRHIPKAKPSQKNYEEAGETLNQAVEDMHSR
ncbi:MAG: hypothetical protein QW192_06815, partial [Candidatus Caldarchaeum sp.]